ncbi:MAG: rhomboid family intramembrane serine protease [Bacteroidota bacterium]
MLRITDVAKNLLIINVMFFLAGFIFGEQQMLDLLALHYPESSLFKPIQLVTHFFMHGGLMHLFFNMFALVMFGSALETRWGPKRFLLFYFICAFGSAALHMGYSWYEMNQLQEYMTAYKANPSVDVFRSFIEFGGLDEIPEIVDLMNKMGRSLTPQLIGEGNGLMNEFYNLKINVPVVGASGAIYGLLLGFGMLFPNVELMLIFLPIPIKAKYFIPVLMLVELYLGFNQFSWDNIAHFAHLGGALTGFLLILYWRQTGQGV